VFDELVQGTLVVYKLPKKSAGVEDTLTVRHVADRVLELVCLQHYIICVASEITVVNSKTEKPYMWIGDETDLAYSMNCEGMQRLKISAPSEFCEHKMRAVLESITCVPVKQRLMKTMQRDKIKDTAMPALLKNHLDLLKKANSSLNASTQLALSSEPAEVDAEKMLDGSEVRHVFIGETDVTGNDAAVNGPEDLEFKCYDVIFVNVIGSGVAQWSLASLQKCIAVVRSIVKLTHEHPVTKVVFVGMSIKQAGLLYSELQKTSFKNITPLVVMRESFGVNPLQEYSENRAMMETAMKSVSHVLIAELQLQQTNNQTFANTFDPHGFRRHIMDLSRQGYLCSEAWDKVHSCYVWTPEAMDWAVTRDIMSVTACVQMPPQAYIRANLVGHMFDPNQMPGLVYDFILKGMPEFESWDPDMTELEVLELNSTCGGVFRSCMSYPRTKVKVTTVSIEADDLKSALQAHVHANKWAYLNMSMSSIEHNLAGDNHWPPYDILGFPV